MISKALRQLRVDMIKVECITSECDFWDETAQDIETYYELEL